MTLTKIYIWWKLGVAFFTEMSRTDRILTDPIPKNPEKSVSRKSVWDSRPESEKSVRYRYGQSQKSGCPESTGYAQIYMFTNFLWPLDIKWLNLDHLFCSNLSPSSRALLYFNTSHRLFSLYFPLTLFSLHHSLSFSSLSLSLFSLNVSDSLFSHITHCLLLSSTLLHRSSFFLSPLTDAINCESFMFFLFSSHLLPLISSCFFCNFSHSPFLLFFFFFFLLLLLLLLLLLFLLPIFFNLQFR